MDAEERIKKMHDLCNVRLSNENWDFVWNSIQRLVVIYDYRIEIKTIDSNLIISLQVPIKKEAGRNGWIFIYPLGV